MVGWFNLNAPPNLSPAGDVKHSQCFDHQDDCCGFPGTHLLHPVTGMSMRPPPFPFAHRDHDFASSSRSPPFPKMEFPNFDGSNPRLWHDNCEIYFEVYAVDQSLKTKFAALNFQGCGCFVVVDSSEMGKNHGLGISV